jgi:hypothetical protein
MPALEHFAPDAPIDQIMAVLERDGALILDDLLTAEEADTVVAEIGPYVYATKPGRDAFGGFSTTRTGALVARSAAVR